jgi:hypothetical protein
MIMFWLLCVVISNGTSTTFALWRFALPRVPRGSDGTKATSTSFFSCLIHDTTSSWTILASVWGGNHSS